MTTKIRQAMLCLLVLFAVSAGCHSREPAPEEGPQLLKIDRTAVFGFRPLPAYMAERGTVRSPLTGSVFISSSVPDGIHQELTDQVYERLSKKSSETLVSPDETLKTLWTIRGTWKSDEKDLLREVGATLESDAVLAGHVYRWQERIGTDYAVSRPASVAFELALLNVADGSIIWKGKFDKTQASLSENILDLNTFLKGKGRWMTAYELAALGVSSLVDQLPMEKRE